MQCCTQVAPRDALEAFFIHSTQDVHCCYVTDKQANLRAGLQHGSATGRLPAHTYRENTVLSCSTRLEGLKCFSRQRQRIARCSIPNHHSLSLSDSDCHGVTPGGLDKKGFVTHSET